MFENVECLVNIESFQKDLVSTELLNWQPI